MITKERVTRTILFITILMVFSLVSFGFRFLIGYFIDTPTLVRDKEVIIEPVEKSTFYTKDETIAAKKVATTFIPLYFQRDAVKLQKIITSRFYSLLKEEINYPLRKGQTIFSGIEKIGCTSGTKQIHCFVTATVTEVEKEKKTPKEQVYELILVTKNHEWFVDEVNVHGTFE